MPIDTTRDPGPHMLYFLAYQVRDHDLRQVVRSERQGRAQARSSA